MIYLHVSGRAWPSLILRFAGVRIVAGNAVMYSIFFCRSLKKLIYSKSFKNVIIFGLGFLLGLTQIGRVHFYVCKNGLSFQSEWPGQIVIVFDRWISQHHLLHMSSFCPQWLFLPDPSVRSKLTLPPRAQVDYRAACFCHRHLIDVGYVCSVCLSSELFCCWSLFFLSSLRKN